jgi:SAM-dependent methyltransferase
MRASLRPGIPALAVSPVPRRYSAGVTLTKLMRDAGNVAVIRAASGESQNFLGAPWVASLVENVPPRARERVALRMLALSPHYFYDRDLRAEAERNRRSRRALAASLIAPHVSAASRVIDYGCGPGYLAAAVAGLAGHVAAVDISPGVLACARVLNPAPNVSYLRPAQLAQQPGQADLAYSFAVVQHLSTPALAAALRLLARSLRPGGNLLLHFAVTGEAGYRSEQAWRADRSLTGRARLRYGLNCFGRTAAELRATVADAGFADVATRWLAGDPVGDDDISQQHLLTATRAAPAGPVPAAVEASS